MLGPAPAPLAILRGRHRRRFLNKAERRVNLQAVLRDWLGRVRLSGSARLQVDIDLQLPVVGNPGARPWGWLVANCRDEAAGGSIAAAATPAAPPHRANLVIGGRLQLVALGQEPTQVGTEVRNVGHQSEKLPITRRDINLPPGPVRSKISAVRRAVPPGKRRPAVALDRQWRSVSSDCCALSSSARPRG